MVFALNTTLENTLRLAPAQKSGLQKLGVETIRDLLWHFPVRYDDYSQIRRVAEIAPKERVTLEGQIVSIGLRKTWKRRIAIAEGKLADPTGTIDLIWFHQPYIAKMLKEGDMVRLTGEVSEGKRGLVITNPNFEKLEGLVIGRSTSEHSLLPKYPETRGITSRWLHAHITKILPELPKDLPDIIPQDIRKRYHLPSLLPALYAMHVPKHIRESEAARKRFAFEEIFLIQLSRARERHAVSSRTAPKIPHEQESLEEFLSTLPFMLTDGQQHTLNAITNDLAKATPMARLLEGDVGSGKTIIAASAAHAVTQAGFQVAYMAPTEILARQHFDAFTMLFRPFRKKIGLLTSSESRVYPSKAFPNSSAHIAKSQLTRWASTGEIPILIGTHALIEKRTQFKNLGLIVVDEQHRFGVMQRARLVKGKVKTTDPLPHFLSMTATPIPRTLALTIYGDLDLSILDELPPGRKAITTIVIPESEEARAWDIVRNELARGHQAFVVCPRIEEGKDERKSVLAESRRIKTHILPDARIAVMHGKLKPKEKEHAMNQFRDGKIDVLVATTVIEVGVDVPNATAMVIEGAERFGLAQLHQMRGRIGRSEHASTCIVITSGNGNMTRRLSALSRAANGFELAEYDLEIRGAGELTGASQWGVSDIGMEALKNMKMVEAARSEAQRLIAEDPELRRTPLLAERVKSIETALLHFE